MWEGGSRSARQYKLCNSTLDPLFFNEISLQIYLKTIQLLVCLLTNTV